MKKLPCTALCALTLLTFAACGTEQPVRENVQATPDAAAPDAYKPGAGLEISAPTLDDVQWIRLGVPAGTKAPAAARSWIEGWDGIVPGEVWYDAEADALWSGTATHDNFNQRVFYDLDYITICFTHSSPSGETGYVSRALETAAGSSAIVWCKAQKRRRITAAFLLYFRAFSATLAAEPKSLATQSTTYWPPLIIRAFSSFGTSVGL